MQLTQFYKNIVQTTLHNFKSHLGPTSAKPFVEYYSHTRTKLLRTLLSPNLLQCRSYSSSTESYVQLPALTNDPKLFWPTIFNALSCFIKCNFVIKPYMDNEFSMDEFLLGSKQVCFIQIICHDNNENLI